MKTRKLNFDDFRENQLSAIGQKSINGGYPPEGPPPVWEDEEGDPPINGVPPVGGSTSLPIGSIKEGTEPIGVKTP